MSNQKAAINGAKWTTSATVITTVFNSLQMAVIARVLDPSIFGLVSICTIILNFFYIFANLGFANSIISTQETDKKKLSTIFFASLGMGLIFCGIINLTAPFVISFYNQPRLAQIIPLASLNFPLVYGSQIYGILLQKELRFRTLAFNDILSASVGIIVTIFLAYKDFQELSIMYGQLALAGTRTITYTITGLKLFRPILYFKLGEIKQHLRFGVYSIGEGLLGFANSNLETIIIGKFISMEVLGYYNIAYQIAIFPLYKLNPIIMQVTFPIMAKMKNNEDMKRAYLKIVDFMTFCNFPLLAGLFITAGTVVPLIFGQNFAPSIPLVHVIVFTGLFSCFTTPFSAIAFSKGKPNLLFILNLLSLLFKLPILYFSAKNYGLMGIIYGGLITSVFEAAVCALFIRSLIGSFIMKFLSNVYKPIIFCLIMVSVIALYQQFIGNIGFVHTFVQIAIGGSVYIALTLRYKISFGEVMNLRKSL
ncbi:MOP flippase family protein [Pedobacter heparinus]|uniref:MOP flippase family protein n=1 Tax=Pedobacter heparinus TaxID=984 RepID=UPI00292FEF43|nr:MOP flippase family protein [Pedobacter heparinus]